VVGRDREAEILRMHPGVSMRRIACALHVSCRFVHRVLGRLSVPTAPRCSFLDAEGQPGSVWLDNGPVTRSPVVST
jgi:hypothetical protein